jgi:hypothetical protein
LFAPPRGLSQLTTSFVASQRQGIRRMPLSTLDRSYHQCPSRSAAGRTHFWSVIRPASPLARRKHDRKTSFASQDRTDSIAFCLEVTGPKAHEPKTKAPLTNVTQPPAIPSCEKKTNGDAPGCRLPQAVAATHVHARMIPHARTPGTIPSSRCQTTRARSILRPARISVLMDEFV